jgi:hypothetical protein
MLRISLYRLSLSMSIIYRYSIFWAMLFCDGLGSVEERHETANGNVVAGDG